MKRIVLLLFILVSPLFFLTGCNTDNSIENLAYVIAIGIDKGEKNLIKLSLQFATPSSSNPSSQSSSSPESTISAVECNSIDSGINLINSYISKRINLAHCKVVVFSEELAYKGIGNELYTLVNNIEIRPECNLIISRCDAYDFLSNSKPVLTNLIEKYYEVVVNSGEYTGYSADIKLIDFYSALKEQCIQPIAILGGINVEVTQKSEKGINYIDQDSSYKAGEAYIDDKNNLEIMGLAVFKDDTLVGELNGIETISHLLLTGKLRDCTIDIPDPFKENSLINLSIHSPKNPNINVKMINNSPFITCNLSLEATILSLDEDSDYTNSENLQIISKYADSYIESHITDYLYKTSHNFNSDTIGFGKKTLANNLTIDSWRKTNWIENYHNSIFKVSVSTLVKTSAIILKN